MRQWYGGWGIISCKNYSTQGNFGGGEIRHSCKSQELILHTAVPKHRDRHAPPEMGTGRRDCGLWASPPNPPPPSGPVVWPGDVLGGGEGGSEEGGGGGGVWGWLGPPSSQGPPMVPAEKFVKLKSAWHRRRRSKILTPPPQAPPPSCVPATAVDMCCGAGWCFVLLLYYQREYDTLCVHGACAVRCARGACNVKRKQGAGV